MQVRRPLCLVAAACLVASVATLALPATPARAAELLVGAATTEITPPQPVSLAGQHRLRISQKVDTPLLAVALALESRDGDKGIDHAIIITCDLVAIRDGLQARLRERLGSRLAGVDLRKIFLTATHTHTAPTTLEDTSVFNIPKEGVMQPAEYVDFLTGRLADVAAKAWESRAPGGVSWTFGEAMIGHNRRSVYSNGKARMYGPTNTPEFRGLEGYEDHGVDMLFFWSAEKQPRAVAINVACTAQEVEGQSSVNADYWHEVRKQVGPILAPDQPGLPVLGWISAAGDQSPHVQWRKKAIDRMRSQRGLTTMQSIARCLTNAVTDTLDVAKKDIRTDVPFRHTVEDLSLPPRIISPSEYNNAKSRYETLAAMEKPTAADKFKMAYEKRVVDRYEQADQTPPFAVELHVIRLGDIAIATNPFELFLDYGVQIEGRSPAVQTFVIQLAGGSGGYLPTEKAIKGGSYSGEPHTNKVGPEGGQMLVDKTVEAINALWKK